MEEDTIKQEAEHEDEKGNQSNINTVTESQEVQINEESKEGEMERGDRETPSVSGEVTARTDQRVHQETTGRQNLEEKELQPEEEQEEESQRDQEESTKGVKEQQLNVENEIRELPERLKLLTEKEPQHQEASQPETDSSPQTQRDVNRGDNGKENELHWQQTGMKRRRREEGGAKTWETFKKTKKSPGEQELKERLGEQNGDPMEFKESAITEQEVRNEPRVWDCNSQQDQDQAPMGQEDKGEEPMES
ncbi:hypothetical protein VZT92_018424 [Zoarces viviparus]|uniref:Uncharacterized protein n=1 Tax=Zoarces viviparus TaxID=48416 RepID=A0AAW1EID0_ZOAVI